MCKWIVRPKIWHSLNLPGSPSSIERTHLDHMWKCLKHLRMIHYTHHQQQNNTRALLSHFSRPGKSAEFPNSVANSIYSKQIYTIIFAQHTDWFLVSFFGLIFLTRLIFVYGFHSYLFEPIVFVVFDMALCIDFGCMLFGRKGIFSWFLYSTLHRRFQ